MKEKIFTLEDMDEEYLKGARRILTFLREEGIICKRVDGCGECFKVDRFLIKLEKKVYNNG
jgi:hypothetical protein